MFGSYKVKLEGELLDKIKKCVDAGSYESIDQFVLRVLEREINKVLPGDGNTASRDLVKKRLQGLPDFLFREHVQVRRLFEIDGQSFLHHAVRHWLCGVKARKRMTKIEIRYCPA